VAPQPPARWRYRAGDCCATVALSSDLSAARGAAHGSAAFEIVRARDRSVAGSHTRLALVAGSLARVVAVVRHATKERRCTLVSGARRALARRRDADRLRRAVRRPAHVGRGAAVVDEVSSDDPARLTDGECSCLACHRQRVALERIVGASRVGTARLAEPAGPGHARVVDAADTGLALGEERARFAVAVRSSADAGAGGDVRRFAVELIVALLLVDGQKTARTERARLPYDLLRRDAHAVGAGGRARARVERTGTRFAELAWREADAAAVAGRAAAHACALIVERARYSVRLARGRHGAAAATNDDRKANEEEK
jgi:hypothetical protein